MKNTFALVKRNCVMFLRNKQVVFLSLLSTLILIALYFLFIANLFAKGLTESAGLDLTSNQINFAIYVQMIMGVLVINSVSLPVGMFTFMAEDVEKSKTEAFLMTNSNPFQIAVAYLISSFLTSFLINFITLVISVIVIGLSTTYWLGAGAFFAVVGALLLTSLIACSVMLLITILIKSSAAIGIINGILGTILGFLCGIYMPYSNMGAGVKYIGSLLPFTHLCVWLKQIALNNVFAQIGVTNEIASILKEECFSAGNVGFVGINLPLWAMILISTIIAIICLIIAVLMFNKNLFNNKSKNVKNKKLKAK